MKNVMLFIVLSSIQLLIHSAQYEPMPEHWKSLPVDQTGPLDSFENKWKDLLSDEWKENIERGRHYDYYADKLAVMRKLSNSGDYPYSLQVVSPSEEECVDTFRSPPHYLDISADYSKWCRVEPRVIILSADNRIVSYAIARTCGLWNRRWKGADLVELESAPVNDFKVNIKGTRIALAQGNNLLIYDGSGTQRLFRTLDNEVRGIDLDYKEAPDKVHTSFFITDSGNLTYKAEATGRNDYDVQRDDSI